MLLNCVLLLVPAVRANGDLRPYNTAEIQHPASRSIPACLGSGFAAEDGSETLKASGGIYVQGSGWQEARDPREGFGSI